MALSLGRVNREVHFHNDHLYTLGALIEELALAERHCRDLSFLSCSCIPEKHLPLIAGLASEGFGFAESKNEKGFMSSLMDAARSFNDKISKGLVRPEDCEKIRAWARESRHRIEYRQWAGKVANLEESENDLVESLNGLRLSSLPELEEHNTREMVDYLCKKHSVPPPKVIRWTDRCDPLHPNAAHIQRDERDGLSLKPRPERDELVFCRGGATAFAVAHEVKHYIDHYHGDTSPSQDEANDFALVESRNGLYTEKGVAVDTDDNLYTVGDAGKGYIHTTLNHSRTKDMAIDKKRGTTIVVGLATAKLVDKYVSPMLDTPLGTMASIGKIAIGAGLLYYGLRGEKGGVMKDLAAFAGAEFILTEVFKYLPGSTIVASASYAAPVYASAPIAVPMAPGGAVITAASQYSRMYQTPTRLTAGYPGVAQVDGKWVDQRV